MSLALPADERRAWIAERLDPLIDAPDAAQLQAWRLLNPRLATVDLESATMAAVLVALVERPEGLAVILTTRPNTMRRHAGQIAFPGGRVDPGETLGQAALREAWEEIGLPPQAVSLAGLATACHTGSGYLMAPVVGFVPPDLPLKPNPAEVVDIFETPLEFLMDPANHKEHRVQTASGQQVTSIAMTWEDRFIWGATATLLRMLYARLFGAPTVPGASPPR